MTTGQNGAYVVHSHISRETSLTPSARLTNLSLRRRSHKRASRRAAASNTSANAGASVSGYTPSVTPSTIAAAIADTRDGPSGTPQESPTAAHPKPSILSGPSSATALPVKPTQDPLAIDERLD